MQRSQRGVAALCLMAFLQGMVFYAPVAALYRTQAGISLGQIVLIESISWLVVLALEIPWGLFTARVGYRASLLVCCGLYFVSKLVFWRADSFGDFLAERLLLSAVVAGLSGCDSACVCLCAGGQSQRALGFYEAAGIAGLLAASVVFALFLGQNYRLAALLTAVSYGLAAQLRAAPRFALFLVAGALLAEVCQFSTVFLSQLLWADRGFGPGALTVAYLALTAAGLCAGGSHRVTGLLGPRRLGRVCFGTAAVCCAGLALGPGPVLCTVFLLALQLAAGVYRPWELSRQNACALRWGPPSVMLSGYSMVSGLVSGAVNADVSLSLVLACCAGLCCAGAVLFEAGFRAQSTQ